MTFESLIKNAPSQVIEKLETLKTLRETQTIIQRQMRMKHAKIVTDKLIEKRQPRFDYGWFVS
jgi:hypothetical protein